MTSDELREAAFEEGVWQLQLCASRLAVLMTELKRDCLVFNLAQPQGEWQVILRQSQQFVSDHGDDERRHAHGN